MKKYYITTPIYYVNDKPHIGHAFCTIVADTLARYHRLFGEDTFFLTGTDEHGQKAAQAAAQRGMTPQAHCDDMSENFRRIWQQLNISNDIFYRTTEERHKTSVQKVLQKIYDQGDIYEDTYEGWYSVSEEIFYMEKDLVNGKSPTGREVQKISEKNYFFKMSKYQERLIEHIEKHPQFIQPDGRRNEVLGFLRKPLQDLCISRPKARMSWGIELPFDKDYVTYVWFDALLNYATAVGLMQDGRDSEFNEWWNEGHPVHLVGKDIITTHAVYWPTMLMAANLQLPQQIYAHGWILNKDMEKMSKSFGDVVSPLDMAKFVGVDPFRYFLIRDIHLWNDSPFSPDLVVNRVNSDLANNLGNLLSRTTNLISKYFAGRCPSEGAGDVSSNDLKTVALATALKVRQEIENMAPSLAIEPIVGLLNHANRFLEEKAPWKTAKDDLPGAGHALYMALECLRIAGILLSPVMPEKTQHLLKYFGCENSKFADALKWGEIKAGSAIAKAEPLFPRINLKPD